MSVPAITLLVSILTKLDPAPRSQPPVKDQLSTLLASIAPLLAGQPTAQSYHYLSASCHRLVLPFPSQGQAIYSSVKEELERSVAGLAREWRASNMSKEAGWLATLVKGWKTWEGTVVSFILITISRPKGEMVRFFCPRYSSTSIECTRMRRTGWDQSGT